MEIDIIDDEPVENTEDFYVELSTTDSRVEVFEAGQQTRVSIRDNDCKLKVIITLLMIHLFILFQISLWPYKVILRTP